MINNRAQYDFVNIPANMIINGEVMPHRNNKDILRGEDACFIVESHKEREIAVFGSEPPMHQMDFAIRASRLFDAASWYRNYVDIGDDQWSPMALNSNNLSTCYIEESENNKTGTGKPPTAIDKNIILRRNQLKSTPFDFTPNGRVAKQPILDLFDDINLIKKFQTNVPANISNRWAYDLQYNFTRTGSYEINPRLPPTILNWDIFRDSTLVQELKTGSGQFYIDVGQRRMKYIKNVKLFVAYSVYIQRNNVDDDPSIKSRQFYGIYYPVDAIRGQNGFSVGVGDVVGHMNDIKQRLNMQFDPFNQQGGIKGAYIEAFCNWMILEVSDRTQW